MILQEFLDYLEEQKDNGSMYVWGAQGQGNETISENWIRRMETSRSNADRAIAFWKKRKAEEKNALRAFDCSGLIMYFFQNLKGVLKSDTTANGLKGMCAKISKEQLLPGDFVFRVYASGANKGKAYHVGVVVDMEKNVIEAKGRDDGVVKRPLNAEAGYWNAFGRPDFLKAEIEGGASAPRPAPAGWELSRLLKKASPLMKGEDVRAIQNALISKGYSCGGGGADGQFGAGTENAVKAFQKANGLAADGVAGQNTCEKLGGVWKDRKATAPASSAGWTLSRLLKRAKPMMKGEDVRAAQRALIGKGYSCGNGGADGAFGDGTRGAVMRFQKAHGLKADGIIGKDTCAKLGGKWNA
ncbi:peptidoglycan-binding protein [Christensenellaceae bacterium 44-20]